LKYGRVATDRAVQLQFLRHRRPQRHQSIRTVRRLSSIRHAGTFKRRFTTKINYSYYRTTSTRPFNSPQIGLGLSVTGDGSALNQSRACINQLTAVFGMRDAGNFRNLHLLKTVPQLTSDVRVKKFNNTSSK